MDVSEATPRIFTVDEANLLVPALNAAFQRIARARKEIGRRIEDLSAQGVELDPEQPISAQEVPEAHRGALREIGRMVRRVQRDLGQVHAAGVVVKDLELGLVDFYSVVDGEPVWLCWQYGERRVRHYHGIEDGFGGRRALPGGKQSGVLYN